MYIQVELGGALRGLKFNNKALIVLSKELDYDEIEGSFAYCLVYAGLIANAFVKRQEFTESFETVCDWVDSMNPADLMKIKEAFEQAQPFKELTASTEKMTKKKQKNKSENPIE